MAGVARRRRDPCVFASVRTKAHTGGTYGWRARGAPDPATLLRLGFSTAMPTRTRERSWSAPTADRANLDARETRVAVDARRWYRNHRRHLQHPPDRTRSVPGWREPTEKGRRWAWLDALVAAGRRRVGRTSSTAPPCSSTSARQDVAAARWLMGEMPRIRDHRMHRDVKCLVDALCRGVVRRSPSPRGRRWSPSRLAPDLNTYGAFMDGFARWATSTARGRLHDAHDGTAASPQPGSSTTRLVDRSGSSASRSRKMSSKMAANEGVEVKTPPDARVRLALVPRAPARASPKPTRWRC